MKVRTIYILLIFFIAVGNLTGCASKEDVSLSAQSREAVIQAEAFLEKSGVAFNEQNYIVAIDDVEKALNILRSTQDPEVLRSNTYSLAYKNLIILNNQLGVSFLKKNIVTADVANYFQKSLDLILRLDQEAPGVKEDINSALQSAGGLAIYQSEAYYFLGTIAVEQKDAVKAKEYLAKLRSSGSSQSAAELEVIIVDAGL